MAILFNHDSIYRNKKFLIPRITKLIKQEKNKENHKKVIKIKRIKGMIQYKLIYNQNKF